MRGSAATTTLNPAGPDLLRRKFGFWRTTNTGYRYKTKDPDDIKLENVETISEGTGPKAGNLKQRITISQQEEYDGTASGDAAWASLVRKLAPTQMISSEDDTSGKYIDFVATFSMSPTTEETMAMEADFAGSKPGVEFEYNYLDRNYETLLRTVDDHTVIPSMNALLEETYNTDTEENILKGATAMVLRRNIRQSYAAINLREKFENQLVPVENGPILKQYEGNKYLFPMYAQVNIPLGRNNDISTAFKENQMSCILTRDVQNARMMGEADTIGTESVNISYTFFDGDGNRVVDSFTGESITVDLMRWLDHDAMVWGGEKPLPINWMYVGPEAGSSMLADEKNWHWMGAYIHDLENTLRDVAREHRRDWEDLINGEKCKSESLIFKVSKYDGPGSNNRLQTFHFMNSAELIEFMGQERKLAFIDTQVKYNKVYTYVVTAYEVVLGTKYVYDNVQIKEPDITAGFEDFRWATIDVTLEPLIKLVEIPLFQSTGKILSDPPLDPEISFVPYKGKPNKLMIFLNTNTGQLDAEPITLTDEEAEDASQPAFNQKRNDGLLTYSTDEPNTAFWIYRTPNPPVDYDDFKGKILTAATTNSTNPRLNLPAGSVPVLLSQKPNKKFYYMFRSVDFHGGLSNPSPVYEIELYNDGGVGYPIIKQYEFGSIDPKTPTKPARKLVQIIPRITQAYLNTPASGLVDESGMPLNAFGNRTMVLGVEDEPLFGKRFKIRLTSKSTGKKLDFNIDFRTKRVRGPIE